MLQYTRMAPPKAIPRWEEILYEDIDGDGSLIGGSIDMVYAHEIWKFYKAEEHFEGLDYRRFESGLRRQKKKYAIFWTDVMEGTRDRYLNHDGSDNFIFSQAAGRLRNLLRRQRSTGISTWSIYNSHPDYQQWDYSEIEKQVIRFGRLRRFREFYKVNKRHDLHRDTSHSWYGQIV